VPGAFPELATSEREKGLNHRQYYVTTKDFKAFSDTKLYFEPGFSVIDGSIVQKGNTYYLFVKNENSAPAEKNIRVTANTKPYDFPTEVSAPITGDYWAEGPAPLQVGDYVYVYFDKYTQGKYGAIRSLDMKVWEDVSDSITFPKGIRHGTAFKVKASVVENLK
jgi:beta-galactosidase